MSGIVFMKTKQLAKLNEFYQNRIGCSLWLQQADCLIFRHGNFLFGFCERDGTEKQGILTFFYDSRTEVDGMYQALKGIAVAAPKVNTTYSIYQFFAKDPEGRMLEFQYFQHPVASHRTGEELLLSRRSVRAFARTPVSEDVLKRVLELSRFAPTSRNTQCYYFKIIRDRKTLTWLAGTRGTSSIPISQAEMAVAVCADPALSKRYVDDGCIAAYHFMLAAWFHGLGTCWIAGMDRRDVKKTLKIPADHYVASITPLGYPAERNIPTPERKALEEFIRD